MKSAESAKSYEPTYNDATCQEMYESSMWELAEEGRQLQKEVKAWPKTNEDAKNLIKKWEVSLIINNIDNYRWLDSEVAKALIKKWYKNNIKYNIRHSNSFICDKKLAMLFVNEKDLQFLVDCYNYFNQEAKNYISEVRKKSNYLMVKDTDGQVKGCEIIINRLKNYINNNTNVPTRKWTSRLLVSDVNIIWSDYEVKWFQVQINRSFIWGPEDVYYQSRKYFHSRNWNVQNAIEIANKLPWVSVRWAGGQKLDILCTLSINVIIDPISWSTIFEIPWLEWLKFKDNDEALRVVNLLLRFKKEKIKFENGGVGARYSRNKWKIYGDYVYMPDRILTEEAINKYYPSIKGSKEFIDYINRI